MALNGMIPPKVLSGRTKEAYVQYHTRVRLNALTNAGGHWGLSHEGTVLVLKRQRVDRDLFRELVRQIEEVPPPGLTRIEVQE